MIQPNDTLKHNRLPRWTAGILVSIIMAITLACDIESLPILPTSPPSSTPTPILTATPGPTHTPTSTPEPIDTGWQSVEPAVETRAIEVYTSFGLERVTVVRINPVHVRFRVLYARGDPRALGTWAYDSDALLVVNGGYFSDDYTALGLNIANGQVHGTSYGDYAGMFAVRQEEAASVRWLRAWPYDPGENLREAVQSFPVLVKPGGVMGFPADADDGRTARRTVVAQDGEGNILFLVASKGYFNLHELAVWLSSSDMGIDTALNLDGGPSSGIWMPGHINVDSLVPVPLVIAVVQP